MVGSKHQKYIMYFFYVYGWALIISLRKIYIAHPHEKNRNITIKILEPPRLYNELQFAVKKILSPSSALPLPFQKSVRVIEAKVKRLLYFDWEGNLYV